MLYLEETEGDSWGYQLPFLLASQILSRCSVYKKGSHLGILERKGCHWTLVGFLHMLKEKKAWNYLPIIMEAMNIINRVLDNNVYFYFFSFSILFSFCKSADLYESSNCSLLSPGTSGIPHSDWLPL